MAHFARLDDNNIVTEVIVVNNDVLDPANEEASGVEFLTEWSGGYSNWKQTSYNGSFRKNYANTGYVYDAARDAFIAPSPFNSWLLNEETCKWEAPIPSPHPLAIWDENSLSWTDIPTESVAQPEPGNVYTESYDEETQVLPN